MEQLFLLEVLVDTIYFESVAMVPQKKQIVIVITCGNLVTLEIRTDTLGALDHTDESKRKDLEINFGKSYLFFAKPDDLVNALEKCPLEVVISNKMTQSPIGNATVLWESDFKDMLTSCNDNVGYMTPAFQSAIYEMKRKDVTIGDIDIFVRLSCFGKNISTNLQVVKPPKDTRDGAPGQTKFLFKSANAATTYECQIFGMGTSQEFIPVAPIYQTVDVPVQAQELNKVFEYYRSNDSDLGAESRRPSVFVMDMPVRDFNPIDLKNLADLLTGHRESLIVRPHEMMFTNLDQLIEVQNESEGSSNSEETIDGDGSSLDLTNLTIAKIEKQLCKNKDCPAAKMFKDYGIGPLATGKALGAIFNKDDVKVPTTYGMSQTFGHGENYGPFGLFSRPKRPDQPFIPRNSNSSMKKPNNVSSDKCKKTCKNSCNKLSGGNAKDIVIRLRGGGICRATQDSLQENSLRIPSNVIQGLESPGVNNNRAYSCRYRSRMLRLTAGK